MKILQQHLPIKRWAESFFSDQSSAFLALNYTTVTSVFNVVRQYRVMDLPTFVELLKANAFGRHISENHKVHLRKLLGIDIPKGIRSKGACICPHCGNIVKGGSNEK